MSAGFLGHALKSRYDCMLLTGLLLVRQGDHLANVSHAKFGDRCCQRTNKFLTVMQEKTQASILTGSTYLTSMRATI